MSKPARKSKQPPAIESDEGRGPGRDPSHAPGHRHLPPPPEAAQPPPAAPAPQHHPGWQRTGGRVDRLRRNERHGDEQS